MGSHSKFYIRCGFGIMAWEGSKSLAGYSWEDSEGIFQTVETNLQSINGVSRNTAVIHVDSQTEYYRSYEGGFIDL